jgi:hypothetical protein
VALQKLATATGTHIAPAGIDRLILTLFCRGRQAAPDAAHCEQAPCLRAGASSFQNERPSACGTRGTRGTQEM